MSTLGLWEPSTTKIEDICEGMLDKKIEVN